MILFQLFGYLYDARNRMGKPLDLEKEHIWKTKEMYVFRKKKVVIWNKFLTFKGAEEFLTKWEYVIEWNLTTSISVQAKLIAVNYSKLVTNLILKTAESDLVRCDICMCSMLWITIMPRNKKKVIK